MAKKTRKRFTAPEKVAILRLHLLEHVAISDLCDQHGIHPTMFYRWQKEFFENGAAALEPRSRRPADSKDQRIAAAGAGAPTQARSPLGTHGGTYQAKKRAWGTLNGAWVPQATRDAVVRFIRHWAGRTGIALVLLVGWLGIAMSKFSRWTAPRSLVHFKWEYVTRIGHLSANYGRSPFNIPLPVACRTELSGRRVAQRAVRPHRVVLPAIPRPLRTRIRHRLELLPLQELVAQAAVK